MSTSIILLVIYLALHRCPFMAAYQGKVAPYATCKHEHEAQKLLCMFDM